jgi:hypothetical protein
MPTVRAGAVLPMRMRMGERGAIVIAAAALGPAQPAPPPAASADDAPQNAGPSSAHGPHGPIGPIGDAGSGFGSATSDRAPPLDAANPAAVPPVEPPPTPHEPEPEVLSPLAGFAWAPFGYLRVQYIAVQDDPNVAYVGRDDGFEIQNARVGVRGQLGKRAAFVLSFDGAVDERTLANAPQGKLQVGLRDAYSDVAIGGGVTARGGYFQAWVDPQALIPDTSRAFVDLPIESRGVRATEGYQTPSLPPGRSIGVGLRLDPGVQATGIHPGFELTAQNGADEFSSNNDNDALALSATAFVRFPHDGWLMVAGRYNPRTVGDLPFRQDETDLQGTLGLHAAAGPLDVEAGGIVMRTTFETTGGPDQDAYGAHAQAMIRLPVALPLAVGYRFGVLDPSSLVLTDRVMEHTAGAVLGVPRLRMRFQLQYVHVVEQQARELTNDRLQIAGELAL